MIFIAHTYALLYTVFQTFLRELRIGYLATAFVINYFLTKVLCLHRLLRKIYKQFIDILKYVNSAY